MMAPWIPLANETRGNRYGHLPGHDYHDVNLAIFHRWHKTKGSRIKVEVLETWGVAERGDEERGRRRVTAIEDTLSAAISGADDQARGTGIHLGYLAEALLSAYAAVERMR
jgi:hypothetical protein